MTNGTNFHPALSLSDLEPQAAVDQIVRHAIDLQASDLFIFSNEGSTSIAVRVLGQIEQAALMSREQGRHLINFFKATAGMDIAEHRRPQEGRWLRDQNGNRVDLRINIVPTLFGEDLAVRILNHQIGLRPLDCLGLSRNEYNRLTGLLASPSGLVLVTGPTGTGKTTSLYACLQHLNTGRRKINTIEDPIEYAIVGVRRSPR